VARRPYATQINLCFGNSARQLMHLRGSACSGNLTGECLNFVRQSAVGKDRQA
jgi:hypothetical protein